jgi:hypothetical protein
VSVNLLVKSLLRLATREQVGHVVARAAEVPKGEVRFRMEHHSARESDRARAVAAVAPHPSGPTTPVAGKGILEEAFPLQSKQKSPCA